MLRPSSDATSPDWAGPPANIRIFRIFVPDSPEVIKHLVFRNRLHPNQDDRDL